MNLMLREYTKLSMDNQDDSFWIRSESGSVDTGTMQICSADLMIIGETKSQIYSLNEYMSRIEYAPIIHLLKIIVVRGMKLR